MKEIDKLQPRAFTRFCMSIGAVPSSYISALTIEEQILWFCSYLEKEVIPAVNNNAEAVTELQNLYVELKDYVDNYFDNLDVQEEINNKLDDMAESGELADIIAQYVQLQGMLCYNTLADMKSAENLVDGSFAKTYGYYSITDGGGALYKIREVTNQDVENDGDIVALHDPNLVAQLIEKHPNVRQFGAYGDNTHDDTTAFKNAITYINSTVDKILNIPTGDYLISDTLELSGLNKLIGTDKDRTRIFQATGECLDKPIIATANDTNAHNHIALKDISIILNGARTVNGIVIYNAFDFEMTNCYVQGTLDSKYNGITLTKNGGYSGATGEGKLRNNRFSRSSIELNIPDTYIENNEIWGDGQDYALKLMIEATNSIIDSNQFIGGETYGAIYFDDVGEKRNYQITNNYFDGSWNDIDTKYGIYCNALLINSIISNNKFWKQKAGAIFCLGCENTVISGNTFIDNDYYNAGISDIQLGTTTTRVCFANIITNNSFYRMRCLDVDKTTLIDRPDSSGKALDIWEQSSSPASVIANNTMTTEAKYTAATYTNAKNIIVNETNPKLIKSIILTTYYNTTSNKFDADTTDRSLEYFINQPAAATNIPTLTETGMFKNVFITTGYQMQSILTKSHLYSRQQDNGSWSNWFSVTLS